MNGLYHALIQRSGPNDVHDRVSVEAESLVEAKRLLEKQYGEGKVASITGERESKTNPLASAFRVAVPKPARTLSTHSLPWTAGKTA